MAGRSRKRGSGTIALTPRPAGPAIGNPPNMPPGPCATAGTAPRPVPARVVAAPVGAAVVQACGTDNDPTKPARPIPADTCAALPPNPDNPTGPDPSALATEGAKVAAMAAGIRFFSFSALDSPALAIHAVELVTDNSEPIDDIADDEVDDSPDVDDVVDDSGEDRFCSAVGTVEVTWVSTAWVFVAVELPVTWATAAPCAASPDGLVVCCGEVNGGNIAAAADAAA